MDNSNVVAKALEYYDLNREKYMHLFKKVKYITFISRQDELKRDVVMMYDDNMDLVYSLHYEVLGMYTNVTRTWQWAWSHSAFPKKKTKVSRDILNYAFDLDYQNFSFLKTQLVNSKFKIDISSQLDIHAAIGSYLSKNPIVYPYVHYSEMDMRQVVDDSGDSKLLNVDKTEGSTKLNLGRVMDKGELGDEYVVYYLILDQKDLESKIVEIELSEGKTLIGPNIDQVDDE